MKHRLSPRWLCAGLFLLACAAQAATPERITTVEGITEYRLDNGLQVLLMPDPSRPTFTVNITYYVGSKHEGYGETGMAHLLEHMLFYGTSDHPDIKAEIAERGGWANGTTWFDRTNYFQTMPAEDDNLRWAIAMEADRMINATISADDLASEMTVVRNEYEIGENNPFRVLMQRVSSVAYDWHGYGRATIGARSDIENVPIERLRDFYRKYYQPDNATLVLAGGFEPERVLELVQQYFGAIAPLDREAENILWPTYTREPVQDGGREVTVRRVGETQLVMAAYHVPASPHEDFAAVEVLSYILGDTPSGRLYAALMDTEMASRVGAFALRLADPGLLYAFAEFRQDQALDVVRDTLLATIAEVVAQPPTEQEVNRAINAITSNIEQTLNNTERVGIALTNWVANGDWRLMYLHRDRIEAVTPEDVARVAAEFLKTANRTIGLFIPDSAPDRAEIPEAPDIPTMLAGYTGREDRAAGEAFATTAENIEARTRRFELANGTQVALLPKQSRGGRAELQMAIRIGDEHSLRDQGRVPHATAALLTRGSENYTRQEFRDRLDELRTTLDIGPSSPGSVAVTAETTGEHLASVLELIAEALMRPVFPERELGEWRRQALADVDNQRTDPVAIAPRLLARQLSPHAPEHPLYTPDFDELAAWIEAVDRAPLVEFHRRFYGFGPGTTLAIVGDFDADVVQAQLETLFGEWTAEVPFTRIASIYTEAEAVELEVDTPDRPNALLIAGHQFPMRDDHPDYPALVLGGYLLGGGFMTGRIPARLREAEGISYGAGGGFDVHPIDELGSFRVFAMYNPENRDRLRTALMEELERALADGFDQEELDAAKRGWAQQQQVIRSDDARLATQLNNGLYLDRDSFYQEELEARVMALSTDDIVEALRRHLDLARLTFAEAGDFAQSEE